MSSFRTDFPKHGETTTTTTATADNIIVAKFNNRLLANSTAKPTELPIPALETSYQTGPNYLPTVTNEIYDKDKSNGFSTEEFLEILYGLKAPIVSESFLLNSFYEGSLFSGLDTILRSINFKNKNYAYDGQHDRNRLSIKQGQAFINRLPDHALVDLLGESERILLAKEHVNFVSFVYNSVGDLDRFIRILLAADKKYGPKVIGEFLKYTDNDWQRNNLPHALKQVMAPKRYENIEFYVENGYLPEPINSRPILRQGSIGSDVLSLQRQLNRFRAQQGKPEITEDGNVGSNTVNAIKDFQRQNNLKADGIVGTDTWNALTQQ